MNDELTNRAKALEEDNASLHRLTNDQTLRWQEAGRQTAEILKDRDDLIERQRKLLEQYSAVSNALAGEMISTDVSGSWTIQTPRGTLVCYVQVYQGSRTMQLTNCR